MWVDRLLDGLGIKKDSAEGREEFERPIWRLGARAIRASCG